MTDILTPDQLKQQQLFQQQQIAPILQKAALQATQAPPQQLLAPGALATSIPTVGTPSRGRNTVAGSPNTDMSKMLSPAQERGGVGAKVYREDIPQVTAPSGTEAYGQQKNARLDFEEKNHMGTPLNHPGLGGKLLHGLSIAGNLAGNILSPGAMAMIPGTQLNRALQRNENNEETKQGAENDLKQAQTGEQNALAEGNELVPYTMNGVEQMIPRKAVEGYEQAKLKADTTASDAALRSQTQKDVSANQIEAKHEDVNAGQIGQNQRTQAEIDAQNARNDHNNQVRLAIAKMNQGKGGTFAPVNDQDGNTIGAVDWKTGAFVPVSHIPGLAEAEGGSTVIPHKPSAASQGRADQADVVTRAGDSLIADLKNPEYRDHVGNVDAILKSAFLNTPLSDPKQSYIAAKIASFAALNPAMHGFKGQDALREFEKIIGGIPKDADALIGAIQGIQSTASSFRPPKPGAQNQPAQGVELKVGDVEDGYRYKGGNKADKNSWEKVQ